jgi:hypothetical protein
VRATPAGFWSKNVSPHPEDKGFAIELTIGALYPSLPPRRLSVRGFLPLQSASTGADNMKPHFFAIIFYE